MEYKELIDEATTEIAFIEKRDDDMHVLNQIEIILEKLIRKAVELDRELRGV